MNDKTPMLEVIDQAKQQGWRHEVSGSGHHKLMPPNGKPMVVTSVSPGDGRAYKNFLAAMRRSGFQERNDRAELMEKRRTRGITETLREKFREDPEHVYNTDELQLIVRARFPEASDNAAHGALNRLHEVGEITRLERGQYRLAKPDVVPAETSAPAEVKQEPVTLSNLFTPRMAAAEPKIVPEIESPATAKIEHVGVSNGGKVRDLLDRFMAIVAEIEAVLREHEQIETKTEELRKLLNR